MRSVWWCAWLACAVGCGSGGAKFAQSPCEQFGVTETVDVPRACPYEIAGDGETVRVFAIGPVIRYAEMEDYGTFCRAWDEVVRTEVLPCLAEDKPNLLVFPENATLAGAFIGSRGAEGRAATNSLAAFFSLTRTYADPLAYYQSLYPDATLIGEQLVLSVTDTLHRAFQTFPAIAERYGVYVAVSSDFAPAVLSNSPSDVALLADPDLTEVTSVYVATAGTPSNYGLFFGPDGEEIGRIAKSYLVPAEEDLLALTHGDLASARPVMLPFARAGMVISKDAWMPDLLHRLDVLGANLMLQPEAFSGWGVEEFVGDWLPDIVRESAWGHTQRHAAFRNTVTPCIKGNLLDLVFDCQSHITKDAALDDAPRAFIGQEPYLGLLTVEPWVIADPGPPTSLEERRAVLRDRGERMLPGSGDPLEDAYQGQVIAADLSLPNDGQLPATRDGMAGALGSSEVLVPPTDAAAHQRFPVLAADEETVVVAWMEGPPGVERVRAFTSPDGDTWTEMVLPGEAGQAVQRTPRVAVGAGRTLVTWEESVDETSSRVVLAVRDAGVWSRVELTHASTGSAWFPDAAIDPSTGRLYVAWLDLRAGGHPKPWVAPSSDGMTWSPVQVDPGNAVTDNPRGNAAFVRVAARDGEAYVAFSDFREFSWDVYLASSPDEGATFDAAVRVNPASVQVTPVGGGDPVEAERLHGDVALTLTGTGAPAVAWTALQDRRYESRIAVWQQGSAPRADDAPAGIEAWRPALASNPAGDVLAVWQDLRGGANHIRGAVRASGSPAFGESFTIDDADPAGHVYAPHVSIRGGEAWVVWEDPRSGYGRIRLVRGPMP